MKIGIDVEVEINNIGGWGKDCMTDTRGCFIQFLPAFYCTTNDWALNKYTRSKSGVKVIGIIREIPAL